MQTYFHITLQLGVLHRHLCRLIPSKGLRLPFQCWPINEPLTPRGPGHEPWSAPHCLHGRVLRYSEVPLWPIPMILTQEVIKSLGNVGGDVRLIALLTYVGWDILDDQQFFTTPDFQNLARLPHIRQKLASRRGAPLWFPANILRDDLSGCPRALWCSRLTFAWDRCSKPGFYPASLFGRNRFTFVPHSGQMPLAIRRPFAVFSTVPFLIVCFL